MRSSREATRAKCSGLRVKIAHKHVPRPLGVWEGELDSPDLDQMLERAKEEAKMAEEQGHDGHESEVAGIGSSSLSF